MSLQTWQAVGIVPVQTWRAGEPSLGADVARGENSLGANGAVPAQSRCKNGRGSPSPGDDVAGVGPVAGANVARQDAAPMQMWLHHTEWCSTVLRAL